MQQYYLYGSDDWQIGGNVTFGQGGVSGSVTAGAGSSGSCPTCSAAQATGNIPWVIILVAVAVLALR